MFDFVNATTGVVTGAAGHLVSATVSNFPAVVGNGTYIIETSKIYYSLFVLFPRNRHRYDCRFPWVNIFSIAASITFSNCHITVHVE